MKQTPLIKGLVSTIVLNWNGKEVIFHCIDSLLAQTYRAKEIILVDNGSVDGSLPMIRQKYGAAIVVIENGENLGFAEGCNVGIRASQGEFIALLNSDATVEKNWMEEMVHGLQKAGVHEGEKIGMAAGKIYFSGDDKRIENTGHVIYKDGLGRGRGRLEIDRGQYDHEDRVFCPNGCAALFRRSMMEEIGMFDKAFFAYADDIDVGFRGRLMGYKCAYIPSAIAYHRLSASFGMLSPLKAFLVERNRLWVLIKCFPLNYIMLSPFYTAVRYFYHFYGIFQHKGPAARYAEKLSIWNLMWIAVKVYLSTLVNLPYLLKERVKIRKKTTTTAKDFDFWLKKYGMTAREVALNEISY
jgi:GT2 family glycosyltransferase